MPLLLAAACAGILCLAGCGDEQETTTSAPVIPTTTDTEATELSPARQRFDAMVADLLTTRFDLTEEQAECAIDQLATTVDETTVAEAARTGAPSPELLEAAFEAGRDCAQ